MVRARLRIDPDRVRVALLRADDAVPHRLQLHQCRGVILLVSPLEAGAVGEPLVVQARRVHGFARRHAEVDHVDHDLQRRVDDRPAAGAARHQEDLAVLRHDGRRL